MIAFVFLSFVVLLPLCFDLADLAIEHFISEEMFGVLLNACSIFFFEDEALKLLCVAADNLTVFKTSGVHFDHFYAYFRSEVRRVLIVNAPDEQTKNSVKSNGGLNKLHVFRLFQLNSVDAPVDGLFMVGQ